jgi:hypothetical protein
MLLVAPIDDTENAHTGRFSMPEGRQVTAPMASGNHYPL